MKIKVAKFFKWLLIAVYLSLLILHIFMLYFCIASIITTCLLYFTAALLIIWILNLFVKRKPEKKPEIHNIKFSILTFLVLLLIAEFVLKYAVGYHKSWYERNGNFCYHSQYRQAYLDLARYRKNFNTHNFWVLKNPINHSRIDKKTEFSYVHSYNSQGFRDNEFEVEKDSNEFRIIGVGDSFTEGIGTPQDSTWLKFLENKIENSSKKYHFTTINAGCAGSDPFFEYMLIKSELLKYKPELLILALNKSDLDDVMIRGGMERFRPNGSLTFKEGPDWEYLYAVSYIFRHFIHDFLKYNFWLMTDDEYAKLQSKSVDLIYCVLVEIQKIVVENKSDLLIVLAPHYYELLDHTDFLSPLATKISKNKELKMVNLYSYFIKNKINSPDKIYQYYWKVDCHHTARGYNEYANGIFETIEHLNLLTDEN